MRAVLISAWKYEEVFNLVATVELKVFYISNTFATGNQELGTAFVGSQDIDVPEAKINDPSFIHELGDFSTKYHIVKYSYATRRRRELEYYSLILIKVARFREYIALADTLLNYYIEHFYPQMWATYEDKAVHAVLL